MLGFGSGIRYFVCSEPVDMRNSFDGLAGIVRNFLRKDPISDGVFVFLNKNRTHLKLLFWDGDGFALYYKRLERGRFHLNTAGNELSVELDRASLNMLLDGVVPVGKKHLKRYSI